MTAHDRPEINRDLWVEADGHPERLYVLGNPHTFPGRITTWSDSLGESLYLSKRDITVMSEAAQWWFEGYLHGNEPTLAEYLGIDPLAADRLDDDDPDVERWRDALVTFRTTGEILDMWPVPIQSLPVASIHGHVPWAKAGGQVWIWSDRSWGVADPQPALDRGMLMGSPCVERGSHVDEAIDEYHSVCIDCGYTSEGIPEWGT